MNTRPMLVCLFAAALAAPVVALAGESDVDSSHPAQYVKDSAITAAVKTRLAANQVGSLMRLKVDTDPDGTVWLSGSTQSQETADRAVEIARNTDGVNWVKSTIIVAPEVK